MRRTTLAILALLAAQLCAAQLPAFLRPDPAIAGIGALTESVDVARLARAALLASGASPERLGYYESRLDGVLGELKASRGQGAATNSAKAEAVLTFLHEGVLKAYREDATGLTDILDSGRYNCVSSAVLYAIAARSLGIEAAGVRTEDHAFASVRVDGRSIDVETTNPYGFDPGGKKEFKDSFGRVTGFAYVAPGGYGDRRPIGAGDLVGLILSNRASALERTRRFAEATRLGVDYAFLCPGPDSRGFLVDRINNLVADLESRRDYAGAEEIARAAFAAMPEEERLGSIAKNAAYNRAASLAQAGDWEAAFDAAILVSAAYPSDAQASSLASSSLQGLAQDLARKGDFDAARRAVAARASRAGPSAAEAAYAVVGEAELVGAVNGLGFAPAAAAAQRILAAGEVSVARYAQAIAAIYGNEAGRIGSAGDWLGGAALAERGIAALAAAATATTVATGSLARLARNLRQNFVAEAHNRFAKLYNAGDYAGAKAAIAAAMSAADEPLRGDATLERDLAAAESALK